MINKKLLLIIGIVLIVGSLIYLSAKIIGTSISPLEKGLVAHWTLDETDYNSNTERITDKTPNENHGTNNGATLTTDRMGQSNRAMSFDGSNYIDAGDDESLELKNLSISVWINSESTQNIAAGIVSKGSIYSDYVRDQNYYLYLDSSRNVKLTYGNGTNHQTSTFSSVSSSEWHHFVIIINGTNINLYIDGNLDDSVPQLYIPITGDGNDLRIGRKSTSSSSSVYYFNGSIDEVRIYSRVLSEEEIKLLYDSYKPQISGSSLEKGLVGHWMLDSEGYNSATERITDKTPYSNHGTNNGAELTTDRMGQSNRAMSFDDSDYIDCGDVIDLGETTVALWFNTSDFTQHNGIIDFAGLSNRGHFDFNHYNDKPLLYFANSNYKYFDPSFQNYLDGEWHFLVLYIKGAQMDDILEATLSVDLNNIPTSSTTHSELPIAWNDLYIGKTSYGSFNGSISDVRIYNKFLSEEEIQLLYYSYRPKAASGSLEKGLVLDMPLTSSYIKDETPGSEIMTDRTPYSNDGQNNGATVGSNYSTFVPNDNINCWSEINFTNKVFSASIWVYPTTTTSDTYMGKWDTGAHPGNNSWLLYAASGNMYFYIEESDNSSIGSSALGIYSINNWYHVVGVANGSTLKLYVDGVLKDENPYDGTINPGGPDFRIGGFGGSGTTYPFNGDLASAKIYNRALSEDEIKLLYDKGR